MLSGARGEEGVRVRGGRGERVGAGRAEKGITPSLGKLSSDFVILRERKAITNNQ